MAVKKVRPSRNLYTEIQYLLGQGRSVQQICNKLDCAPKQVYKVHRGRSTKGVFKICSVEGCNEIVPDDLHFMCRRHYKLATEEDSREVHGMHNNGTVFKATI